jgi:hypothetical protein
MSGQGQRRKDAPAVSVARRFSEIKPRLTENAFPRLRANPSEAGKNRGRSENRFASAIASDARRLKKPLLMLFGGCGESPT